jgi:hypothetical protein
LFQLAANGKFTLASAEAHVRSSALRFGAAALERLLSQSELTGTPKPDPSWKPAGQRQRQLLTVLGPITFMRQYYRDPAQHSGHVPLDTALGLAHSYFSPGVQRMMSLAGANHSFATASTELQEIAGLSVTPKEIERYSEKIGKAFATLPDEIETPSNQPKVVYVLADGTGVPVIANDAEGHAGKNGGQAKTRETKLGCVFTQTSVDAKGRPIRDENTTSYIGGIETVENFGPRLAAEVQRRGLENASKTVFLGDGALWLWNLAYDHFPNAIQIVDLYHAREHYWDIGRQVFGLDSPKLKLWCAKRKKELDKGDITALKTAILSLKTRRGDLAKEIEKTMDYFEKNRERMQYAKFRQQGLFVGSGVVEAGCKTVIGQLLKCAGMHWTVDGANSIISLRCRILSKRWEHSWHQYNLRAA